MDHLSISHWCWKKIVYLSRKYAGIRAIALAWLAVYLLCRNMVRCLMSSGRKMSAVTVSLSLALTLCLSNGVEVVRADMQESESGQQEEIPDYELDIAVLAPAAEVTVGYETAPEYEIELTNVGGETLSGIQAGTEFFELYWLDSNDERHLIPEKTPEDEEAGSGNTENIENIETENADTESDSQQEDAQNVPADEEGVAFPEEQGEETMESMPNVLEPGETLTLFAVLPMDCPVGTVEDTLVIGAAELEDEKEIPLWIDIVSQNEDDHITEPGNPGVTEPVESDNPEMPEVPTDPDKTEPTEPSSNLEEPDENSNEPQEDDGVETEENIQTADETDKEEDLPENISPKVELVERGTGYFMGNIFMAVSGAQYRYSVDAGDRDHVKELSVCWGDEEKHVPVENGTAVVQVPSEVCAQLRVSYQDANGETVVVTDEYVVNEQSAPEVSHSRVVNSEEGNLQICIQEKGKVNSGINEYSCLVDGEKVSLSPSRVVTTMLGAENSEVVTELEFQLKLEEGLHQIEVQAQDYTGNITMDDFSMNIVGDDVISVVLPTRFAVKMDPFSKEDQVVGDNIVVCNKSDFPVDVAISSVEVSVDQSIPDHPSYYNEVLQTDGEDRPVYDLHSVAQEKQKSCDLKLRLMKANEATAIFAIPEGETENLIGFQLAGGNSDTDAETLQEDAYANTVKSPDYAILNIRGNLSKGTESLWKDGDLKIKIVFDFRKVEEKQSL